MKKEEVPQDNSRTYSGHKKVIYAINQNGKYEQLQSSGWKPEEFVTIMAVEELDELTAQAREKAESGIASPLEYHMYRRRMDLAALAQISGFFKWQIRRHFSPGGFARLSDKQLARYQESLGISVAELKKVP